MSWACDIPEELLCRPTGLTILSGLDTKFNAIHKAVWDAFCNNRRPDRVPLKFKALEADHEFPKCRSKRTTYEWYIPKGVVKTGWMHKHLVQIPAVVVIFFDLDWDEMLWKERQMECATRVEIVRNSLSGRNTRVAVVLIQQNAPLPPGEDVVAAERAASLCTACELNAKSLFVLPHTDHLLGYVIRLENAFYELSQSYYYSEARRVKSHKEYLNKTTHQLLFVRHQFKIGFYNELKQDTNIALKHYKQAYGHILDLRMHDTNLLEVKTIAGFLNYKICRLSFQHNVPLDAIAQFRKHIDFFKSRVGCPDLAFEHSSWISKQFQMFADLFDEAIKLGLTAVQTQHPGFYYQQAANHAIARKHLANQLCHSIAAVPYPDPLENLNNLDYYGQRPWRQGHQSIEPPDAQREKDGIRALHTLELTVDHSSLIIPLLNSAVAQFKKYKSPRMKRYLMVQMGEEYYHAKDYQKALSILSRVTWDYRTDRWWPLLTSIQKTALRCAYLTGSVQEYITIAMELLNADIQCSPEEKTRMQRNLISVMVMESPLPEPDCPHECTKNAELLWQQRGPAGCDVTTDEDRGENVFTVDMSNILGFVECRAMFSSPVFKADEKVQLFVFLRTSCPEPLRFSKLSVSLSNPAYNCDCLLEDSPDGDGDGESLLLDRSRVSRYHFSFLPQARDVSKQIQITSVTLELGTESGGRCAALHWGSELIHSLAGLTTYQQSHRDGEPLVWDKIPMVSSTSIAARQPLLELSLEHSPPSLVDEFYRINVVVHNAERHPLRDVTLCAGLCDNADLALEQSTHVSVDVADYDNKVISRRMGLSLRDLPPDTSVDKVIYVKNLQTGPRTILVKISYSLTVPAGGGGAQDGGGGAQDGDIRAQDITCECSREERIQLETVTPFEVDIRLNSMKFEGVECVHVDEPFLLLTDITNTSPWTLDFKTSELRLSPYVRAADGRLESYVCGLSLERDESAAECHRLSVPPHAVQHDLPLGIYTIHWRRHCGGDCAPYVATTVTLPNILVEHIPLYIESSLPSHGSLRLCLPLHYTLHNRTAFVQDVEITMDNSDSFMYSGYKQFHFQILPGSRYQLDFNLFPLLTGYVELPKLRVNMVRYPALVADLVAKMLPTHIFIKPCGKDLQPTLV